MDRSCQSSRSRSVLYVNDKGSEPSASASRESDFAKLTEVLSGIIKTGSRKSNYINEKILPEFDPELKNLSASDWVQKIDTCGEMYDWDSKTKLYLGILKLRGNAKLWHDELQNSLLTWEVFSLAIVRQFPGEESFGKLMEDAVNYKSSPGQDLQAYCFAKLGKINKLKLELSEEKMADLIAQGIHDESIRTIVLAARNKSVAELNKCLSVFPNPDESKDVKDLKFAKVVKRSFSRYTGSDKSKINNDDGCYKCGKRGHIKRFCPDFKEYNSSKDQNGALKTQDFLKNQNRDNNKIKCAHCGILGTFDSSTQLYNNPGF